MLFISCGKKAETGSSVNVITPPIQQPTDLDVFLAKQEVNCQAGMRCPDYLAKIIVLEGSNRPKVCTGFLTDSETIATSSTCLTSILRQDDQDCSKDVFFYFPRTLMRDAMRVGCRKVIQTSLLDNEDPVYTRSDIAYLSLSQPVRRNILYISRDGLENDKEYTRWSIEQSDPYLGIVRNDKCRAIHKSYINPLVTKETSPNMIFGDCPFRMGNTGAPVIENGKLRGMISSPVRQSILTATYETFGRNPQTDPLKEMSYGTNMSCAPSIYDSEVKDEHECSKDLTYQAIGAARGVITDLSVYYNDMAKKIEDIVNKQTKFLKFVVHFVNNPATNYQDAVIVPLCFKNFGDWRSYDPRRGRVKFNVQFPKLSYKYSTDAYSRILGLEKNGGNLNTFFEFNVRNLRYEAESGIHKTTLYMQNSEQDEDFSNFTLCK